MAEERAVPGRSDVTRPIPGGVDVPEPPFWGSRVEEHVALDDIAGWLDERSLYAGRWGLKAGKSGMTYEELVATEGAPRLTRWLDRIRESGLDDAKVVWGYWPCLSDANDLVVGAPGDSLLGGRTLARFSFPRQSGPQRLCLADYFRDRDEVARYGPDVVSFHLVTLGSRMSEETARLFGADSYRDYFELHGLSVQLTEALAELWHARIRDELGFAPPTADRAEVIRNQVYPGERFSFGYPACPDLEQRAGVVALLQPGRIGVALSEEYQLHPEQSTDAVILHHPEAHYFSAR